MRLFWLRIIFFLIIMVSKWHSFAAGSEIGGTPLTADEESSWNQLKGYGTINGNVRVRGDFLRNQKLDDFTFNPGTHDEGLIQRTRLGLSLTPTEHIKGFVQGQFYTRQSNLDYTKVNLYQTYLELLDPEKIPLSLKIGRQELSYGSTFFLGANDFYDGLVWDAAKLHISPINRFWLDAIAARYVKLNRNSSDDEPALYGGYSSLEWKKFLTTDLYFFYHKGGFKFFHDDLPDHPRWFTAGTRAAGKILEQIDYELEPVYQFGRIDNPEREDRDTIAAFGGHFEAGYTFKSPFEPRVFVAYGFGTGDNDSSNKTYQEFHGNIYNDHYLVGDTSLIADMSGVTVGESRASGMHIIASGCSVNPHPRLNLSLDYHYFFAAKTPENVGKNLGGEINLIATYQLFRHWNLVAGGNRFFTGKFFEDAAGSNKDIQYFYLQLQFSF